MSLGRVQVRENKPDIRRSWGWD